MSEFSKKWWKVSERSKLFSSRSMLDTPAFVYQWRSSALYILDLHDHVLLHSGVGKLNEISELLERTVQDYGDRLIRTTLGHAGWGRMGRRNGFVMVEREKKSNVRHKSGRKDGRVFEFIREPNK